MNNIYVVRHGESQWNLERKHQGWHDVPLSELGIEQTKAAGHRLHDSEVSLIISSSSRRSAQSAEIIADQLGIPKQTIILDPDLRDAHRSASREGGTFTKEEIYDFRSNLDFKMPDGESTRDLMNRTVAAWQRMEQHLTADNNILVVTHGINIKAIMWHALGLFDAIERNPWLMSNKVRTNNASLTTFQRDPAWADEGGIYRMLGYNDIGHVIHLLSPLTGGAYEP
jgi:broad specificity phosphatase PhoE